MGRGNDADFGQPLTCAQGFGGGRELVGHETVEEIPIDPALGRRVGEKVEIDPAACLDIGIAPDQKGLGIAADIGVLNELTFRSEEHTSELQSLMRTSYAVFCLKK